jgi:amidase
MEDRWNAFMNKQVKCHPTGSGKLNGRTFAVKDVFAIRNVPNSAGNPDWLRTHSPAKRNAPVIDTLLKQGASLTGTTHTDELMYSLNG